MILAQALTEQQVHGNVMAAREAAHNQNANNQEPTDLLTRISNVAFPIIRTVLKATLVLGLLAANIALPIIPLFLAHAAITGILAYAIVSLLVIGADLLAFRYCVSNASIRNALTRLFTEGVI